MHDLEFVELQNCLYTLLNAVTYCQSFGILKYGLKNIWMAKLEIINQQEQAFPW